MSDVSTNKLETYAEEFFNSSSDGKLVFIPNKNVEVLICKNAQTKKPSLSYSSIIRFLNKEYSSDTVQKFQKLFKENFDRLYLQGYDEPEEKALEIAISSVEHLHKNANAIEMGDSTFAGKRLSDLVKFLLRRIPDGKRSAAIQTMKKKLYMLNEYEISRKITPAHSSMGQAVTIVKNILLEHNPQYIRNVLNALVKNL